MPEKNLKKFLFVCTGNVCRSLMAEKLFAKMAADKKLDLEVKSAGISGHKSIKVPKEIKDILGREGVAPLEHVSTRISGALMEWADGVFTMTAEQRAILQDMFPQHEPKIFLLRERAGFPELEIEDPMGMALEDYEFTAGRIKESLEKILPAA